MKHPCKLALLTTAALATASTATRADETVAVVASIKPIHSLVASVMDGAGTPTLLVRGGDSPHTYSLRPSDAAALEEAQVVFWVGEGLETFLGDTIATIAEGATSVELGEIDGLVRLEARTGGTWDAHVHDDAEHDHDHEHDHEHEHEAEHEDEDDHDGHDHAGFDSHLWLDPVNAQAMVEAIAAALAAADPAHADLYHENAAATRTRLEGLVTDIEAIVAPVRDRPFIVFHDAYHSMEHRFGLNGVGSITLTPDIQPGAARLQEIRDKITELGAVCVFTEPQFEPVLVETVVEGTAAQTAALDPLGADLADGPDLYFDLMLRNAQALHDCLSRTD